MSTPSPSPSPSSPRGPRFADKLHAAIGQGLRYGRTGAIGLFLLSMIAAFAVVIAATAGGAAGKSTTPPRPSGAQGQWVAIRSTTPADLLAAVKASSTYQAVIHAPQTNLGAALQSGTLATPVLVHAYRPKPGMRDVWVVPVRDGAGRIVALLDFAYDAAGHRISALGFAGPFVTSDPEYGRPFPRYSAAAALSTFTRVKGPHVLVPGAQPQLVYFAADLDRINNPAHPLHWTGGGQFPDLAIWRIPASAVATSAASSVAAQDNLIGYDGAIYSPSQLPFAP